MRIICKKTKEEFEVTGQVNVSIDLTVLPKADQKSFAKEDGIEEKVFVNYSFVDSDELVATTSIADGEAENSEFKLIE